jgi:uncharacterized protein YdeI (YjbR/CyaY-like superfamily)
VTHLETFSSARAFREWLEAHHETTRELLLRCYKSHAGDKGLTYPEAVDEALCFGWIDGVRRSVDSQSFSVRFTPRKAKSTWSAVNIRRARELQAKGRMHPAGKAAFTARDPKRSRIYSFEVKAKKLDPAALEKFQSNEAAWRFFQQQPPWYQRTSIFWVMSAKRETTRQRRLDELIASSARKKPIKALDRTKKPK